MVEVKEIEGLENTPPTVCDLAREANLRHDNPQRAAECLLQLIEDAGIYDEIKEFRDKTFALQVMYRARYHFNRMMRAGCATGYDSTSSVDVDEEISRSFRPAYPTRMDLPAMASINDTLSKAQRLLEMKVGNSRLGRLTRNQILEEAKNAEAQVIGWKWRGLFFRKIGDSIPSDRPDGIISEEVPNEQLLEFYQESLRECSLKDMPELKVSSSGGRRTRKRKPRKAA